MKASMWNMEDNPEYRVETPNGVLLYTQGKNDAEHTALHEYIQKERGVEGIKHVVAVLHLYYEQTGGKDPKEDAVVTPYKLLRLLGYSEARAGEKEEQKKVVNTILYMSRTWAYSNETKWEKGTTKRKGRNVRNTKKWTPLLVIEALELSEEGGLAIPESIEFHLGRHFYDALFGEEKQFFSLPTAAILGFHADREQMEICLAYYITNMLTVSGGAKDIHFPTLLKNSALRTEEEIEKGNNRMRDAMRALYAIEALEKDGWCIRSAHELIDTALAIDVLSNPNKMKELAEATQRRIIRHYAHLKGLPQTELKARQRKSLQTLLETEHSGTKPQESRASISFKAGPLTKEQTEKLASARKTAQERRENAYNARTQKSVKATGKPIDTK